MIEIICQGKSPSEARQKCTVAKILLTELLPAKKVSIAMTVNLINAIGGISIAESENKE